MTDSRPVLRNSFYPVNRAGCDRSIAVLREALRAARMGRNDKRGALRKLAEIWGE